MKKYVLNMDKFLSTMDFSSDYDIGEDNLEISEDNLGKYLNEQADNFCRTLWDCLEEQTVPLAHRYVAFSELASHLTCLYSFPLKTKYVMCPECGRIITEADWDTCDEKGAYCLHCGVPLMEEREN